MNCEAFYRIRHLVVTLEVVRPCDRSVRPSCPAALYELSGLICLQCHPPQRSRILRPMRRLTIPSPTIAPMAATPMIALLTLGLSGLRLVILDQTFDRGIVLPRLDGEANR